MDATTLQAAPRELYTPHLRLEHPREEHAAIVMESVNASLGDLRFIAWGQVPFDPVTAARFCRRNAQRVAAGECLIYFAFDRDSGEFVGNLDLHSFDFDVPRCQIGYVADSRHAGRGLMHEAGAALVQLAFELGVVRVEAFCDARNLRSIRLAERLGMRREGVLRAFERDEQGELSDQVVLARLRDDVEPR
jgi:RimJ/RimL family protein N-acetyltransferase